MRSSTKNPGGSYEPSSLSIKKQYDYLESCIIQDQVHTDNQASIALHNSLEFETDGYVFKNAKDKDVLLYLFCL